MKNISFQFNSTFWEIWCYLFWNAKKSPFSDFVICNTVADSVYSSLGRSIESDKYRVIIPEQRRGAESKLQTIASEGNMSKNCWTFLRAFQKQGSSYIVWVFKISFIIAVTFFISCSLKERLYKLYYCHFNLCLVFKCIAFPGLQSRHLKYGKSTCFLYDMVEIFIQWQSWDH